MDNLDTLVKSLNRLENYTAKYIYKKYIEIYTNTETSEIQETTEILNTPETPDQEQSIEPFKYSKQPLCKEEYKKYKDRIFSKERKSIIKQDEVLKEDLENMSIADEEYEKNPSLFHRQKHNSYPDEKRCSFIRKIKHKLIRCKNSIINNDEDVCSLHEITPNIYWDQYNDLIEKIKK